MNNRIFSLIIIGATVVILAGFYVYQNHFSTPAIQQQPLVSDCNISEQACKINLANGATVTFNVTPRGLPPLKSLLLDVQLTGLNAKRVTVDFQGVDMKMGLFPYPLKQLKPQHFQAKGMLSVCILDQMAWLAHLQIETDNAIIDIPFPFETKKNP